MSEINIQNGKQEEKLEENDENNLQEKLLQEQEEVKIKYGRNYNSYEKANFLSKIFFVWVTPLMKLGNKVYLEQDMLDPLAENQKSKKLHSNFNRCWNIHKGNTNRVLLRTLFSAHKGSIILCLVMQFMVSSLDLVKPVIIRIIIAYAGQDDKDIETGIMWLAIMISITVFQSIMSFQSDFQFNLLGYSLNNSVVVALYEKSLRVSLMSNKRYKSGEIINLAQVDAGRLYTICTQMVQGIFLPIQLIIGMYMLYMAIGLAFLGGVSTILILSLINFFLSKFQIKNQKKLMKLKDDRMKITNEVFGQIKFIKVNAWEEFFYKRINDKRDLELNILTRYTYIALGNVFLAWATFPLILSSVFTWYTLSGHNLTAEIAFPVISLFQTLSQSIQALPNLISRFIEALISVKRLQEYLLTEEINTDYITEKQYDHTIVSNGHKPIALAIENGTFNWGPEIESQDQDKDQSQLKKEKKQRQKLEKEQIKRDKFHQKQLKKEEKQRQKKAKQNNNIDIEQNLTKSQNSSDIHDGNINFKDSDVSSFQASQQQITEPNLLNKQSKISDSSNFLPVVVKDINIQNDNQIKDAPPVLKDLNFQIEQGKMVAFIGDVGSGKSSFFYSLIGEMKIEENQELKPKLSLNGNISLVNQKPWVLSDTIENNILFGQEYNKQKYDDCVKYACLTHDFTVLARGDQTMIGEKGVNLSGGQKARVALARAIYQDSDILLLDDILSAVDIHVGKSIVKDCLMNYKQQQTRVLITHALYYMKYMDYIYLLKDGQVAVQGSYQDLKNSQQFQEIYDKFMEDQKKKLLDDDEVNENEEQQLITQLISSDEEEQNKQLEENLPNLLLAKKVSSEKNQHLLIRKKSSIKDIQSQSDLAKVLLEKKHEQKGKYDDLFLQEDRKKGEVGLAVYWKYIKKNGGICYLISIALVGLLSQMARMSTSIWVMIWTNKSKQEDLTQQQNKFYLTVFASISIIIAIGALIRVSIIQLRNLGMVKKLHRSMVLRLLYAPVNEFFDRVPLGRILNRLSKDLNIVDTELGFAIGAFIVGFYGTLGSIVLCVYGSSYYVLIPICFYVCLSTMVYKYYIKTNRELTRLESISKSPVVSFFGETLNGLHSVRAYKRQDQFLEKHCNNVDENKKNQLSLIASNSWFRIILSIFSVIINITALSFSIFSGKENQSKAGILLTYALNLDLIIRWMILNLGWMENRLVSFERCLGFLEIDSEDGYQNFLSQRNQLLQKKKPLHNRNQQLENWPPNGVVEFNDVHVRYRQNLDPVLKGVNFKIKKEEKIGIVGRTGAGKSTITLCLLRVLEIFQGHIFIDGIDISKLSLDEVRSRITIILQDPQLFEGSLRDNIDPLKEHTDDYIEETLRKCNLHKFLTEREGLKTEIAEGGGNLSVGEKQLFCIARALLKKSKLVLIDEATANIDIQTENLVQNTLKEVFKNCTVLTIAHRINTILESDRILVMKDGKVEEFDQPQVLLQNPDSLFYSLHEEAMKEHNI